MRLPLAALTCTVLLAAPASANELRFSATAAGGIAATGNTLGLSKQLDGNGPGLEDSIGTFISLDPASVDDTPVNPGNPWFAGTTADWTMNGSEAELVLPRDVEVLYAELIWGGSWLYFPEDVSANLDDPVTLAIGGMSTLVTPDPITSLTVQETSFTGFEANYYMRSADVTTFVAAQLSGTYSVSGVPATQSDTINSLNAAGWTLVVAYRDSAQQIRNLSVFVGGSFVDEDAEEDYDVAGFCAPPFAPVEGDVVISAIEGDADLVGDRLLIAETMAGPFADLSGANNPIDNFFSSQINDATGALDTTGTFGTRNHDPVGGTTVSGGRQSWDITTVPVSSQNGQLAPNQTSAVIRTRTTGDSYVPTLAAFAIDINAPDFAGGNTGAGAAPTMVGIGDTATVTVDMENVGPVDAVSLSFTSPLPTGLTLDSFTIDGVAGDIDGNMVTDPMMTSGVNLGDVPTGTSKQVVFVVRSTGAPDGAGNLYQLFPRWDYDYISCVGEPPLTEPHFTPVVAIDFIPDAGTTGGGGDSDSDSASGTSASASATDTSTATAGDEAGVSDSASAGQSEGSDGCGCRTNGGSAPWLLGLWGLVALRRRRR